MQVQQNMVKLWSEEIDQKIIQFEMLDFISIRIKKSRRNSKWERKKLDENRNISWKKLIFCVGKLKYEVGEN